MSAPVPSAELHLHIDGCLESPLLVEIARRNGIPLPSYDPDVLDARYASSASTTGCAPWRIRNSCADSPMSRSR
ncbi:hypothetical protein [Gryllotalpicola koreensis]|uniref:Adenosine deaminase domain-containing protein n=1 Tax=Gryllotalpicola koreensis TaxID=993086 RepID=A0ABP8A6F3_9MICO